MRSRWSQDQATMGQGGGKMKPSRSGDGATWEPRWRPVGAQMWVGGGLVSASWRLLGASLPHSGGHLGSGSSMQGGLVNSGLAPMRDQRRPAWARWGGVLGSVAIAFEPASGGLGAIMVGLGALVGHPRRASEDAPGPFCAKEQNRILHIYIKAPCKAP